MDYSIEDIHEKLFKILDEYHQYDKSKFFFTLRTNNIDGRLENGYWFLGDDQTAIVSFWNGINISTGLPDIYLSINVKGYVFLNITIPLNNESKRSFLSQIARNLNLPDIEERKFFELHKKHLGPFEYLIDIINEFLKEKVLIDNYYSMLEENWSLEKPRRNDLGLIPKETFLRNYRNTKKYQRDIENSKYFDSSYGKNRNRPFYIKYFEVKNFMSIERAVIENLSDKNRWIFITGENGSGKTVLLKSIAYSLTRNLINRRDYGEYGDRFSFDLELYQNESDVVKYFRDSNFFEDRNQRRPLVRGFAAYGVYRLNLEMRLYKTSDSALSKKGSIESLMKPATPLIDFVRTLKDWGKNKSNYELFKKRESFLLNTIIKVAPGIKDIHFDRHSNEIKADFFVQYGEGPMVKLSYSQLSSGTKSILTLVSDIIIRFYDQQPEIYDPSQFKGVVLIDEIDLHLHPQAQIELVQSLHSVFPGIQFIVTTHSPMPLLGAPKNSVIYTMANVQVNKSDHLGVNRLRRLDDIVNISRLLPNSLLTSPIFDVQNILPAQQEDYRNIRTEESWKEIKENDKVRKSIQSLLKNLKS